MRNLDVYNYYCTMYQLLSAREITSALYIHRIETSKFEHFKLVQNSAATPPSPGSGSAPKDQVKWRTIFSSLVGAVFKPAARIKSVMGSLRRRPLAPRINHYLQICMVVGGSRAPGGWGPRRGSPGPAHCHASSVFRSIAPRGLPSG